MPAAYEYHWQAASQRQDDEGNGKHRDWITM